MKFKALSLCIRTFVRKAGGNISKIRMFLVLVWMPFLFVSCGEDASNLQIDPTGTSFVHYNCTRQGIPFCGLWVYQNGHLYDGLIDQDGLHLELIR